MEQPIRSIPPVAALIAASIAAYFVVMWPIFGMRPFFDDVFLIMRADQLLGSAAPPTISPATPEFYRPIELGMLVLSRRLFGDNYAVLTTIGGLIHVATAITGAAIVGLVLKRPAVPALLAFLILLFHPAAQTVAGEIDTQSENIARLAAVLELAAIVRLSMIAEITWQHWAALAATLLLGLFAKESFAGMALAAPALMLVGNLRDRRAAIRRVVLAAILAAVCFLVYLAAREAAGYSLRPSQPRYDIKIDAAAIVNAITVGLLSVFPGDLTQIGAYRNVAYGLVSGALAGVVGCLALVALAPTLDVLKRESVVEGLGAVILSIPAAMIPTVLARAVSEHSAGLALTPVAILLVVLVCVAFRSGRLGSYQQAAAAVLVLGAGWTMSAVIVRPVELRETSRQSAFVGETLRQMAVSRGSITVCFDKNAAAQAAKYSVFKQNYSSSETELDFLRAKYPGKTLRIEWRESDQLGGCDLWFT